MKYIGTNGNDDLTGTSGNDVFYMWQGGNDQVHAGDGNDTINFGATFNASDSVDGGTGYDTLVLDGDYGGTIFFSASMLQNVERIQVAAGHNYSLDFYDGVIASGQSLTIDATASLASDDVYVDPSYMTAASASTTVTFNGGAGTDYFTGGPGASILHGGSGNDYVYFGGQFNTTDKIDGGGGAYNSLSLNGDYSAGLAITSGMMKNIQYFYADGGYSYKLVSNDANVGAGQVLHVLAYGLTADESLSFNGSHETDGSFDFSGGVGNDVFIGGAQEDSFTGTDGGNDTFYGNGGDDQVHMGGALTAADRIDGGSGNDEVDLSGDYAAGLVLKATTLTNVETLSFYAGHSYKLTMNDGDVAAGQHMAIDGDLLQASDTLIANASLETNGSYSLLGGAGDDTLIGGQAGNTLYGNLGQDKMTAGAGADVFRYVNVDESTGPTRDVITGFNAQHDKFDLPSGVAVGGIDATVGSGTLTSGHFDYYLAAAIDGAHLAAGHAVLFTPDVGNLAGDIFLIVDANGVAGYQAGQDFVMQLVSATHLANLGTGDFM